MNYPIIFEEWRLVNLPDVVKNYYWISNLGRLKNKKGDIIKPQLINTGYYTYRLYTGNSNKKYKHVLAHRLVKLFFDPIPNPSDFTVNHEDLNKTNNYEWNLTWMTQAENNLHKESNYHLYGVNVYNATFSLEQLKIIINELQKGTSYKEILRLIGLEDTDNNRDYIGNIKRGKTYQREIQNISSG